MWLAIIVLAASLVALAAGGLTWLTKRQPPTAGGPSVAIDSRPVAAAVLYAGVAFGGTITVLLGIYYFLVR
jgi:hypothetical protein